MKTVFDNSTWLGRDIQNSERWTHNLSPDDIGEIDSALSASKSQNLTLAQMTKADFPLPNFSKRLDNMLEELENGLGLYLLRGFPANNYNKDDLRRIFWGIGLHCGTAVSQSKRGDVLGDVRNIGTPHDGPIFRGYTSNGKLTYHCDAADVTGLFCLHPAKIGGLSRIVSLSNIHNQIQIERPDLLAILYQPFYWGRQGNELPGQNPYYTQPIFSICDGKFAGRYTRTHIRTAELGGVTPPLTDLQQQALALIDEICERPEFQLTMMFKAGDMQFLNNHVTLHTRTAFEDYEMPNLKRHLLRLWFSPPNSRTLDTGFEPFFRKIKAGTVRGGFPGHDHDIHFQTD